MADTQDTFARYNKEFQEKLGILLLDDKKFAERIGDVLKIEFLEQKYLQVFVEQIYKHRNTFRVHPSRAVMETVLKAGLGEYPDVTKKMVREYWTRWNSKDFEDEKEWIKSESLDFCRKQKLKEELIKASKKLSRGTFEEASDILQKALKLGSDTDFGHDYAKDFEDRYAENKRFAIATGWKQIDDICQGGLGRGELGVVISPTGGGKSMVLVHLGASALRLGLNVIYYTLELDSKVIGRRFDACISGIRLDNLDEKKEDVKQRLTDAKLGQLIIKKYPRRTATVNTIRSHLDRVIGSGQKIDMILVDYGDILKPSSNSKGKEKRHELEEIYEDLTTLVEEYNIVGYTASQTNRSGLNEEIVTMESISEAYNKCFPAHFIFSLSRTIVDKNNNGGRIFIAKNRSGKDGLIYSIFMDPGNVEIKVIENYIPESATSMPVDEVNKALLAKKFKQFKKNKTV